MSNVDNWIKDVNARVGKIAGEGLVLLATTGTMLDVGQRVWGEGRLTNGQRITYTETYPVYVYAPPWPRKGSGRGKPNAEGKSNKIKGGYYATYLAAKASQGRADLPFELTGDLRKDYFGGVQATPEQDGELVCFVSLSGKNVGKWQGLTQKKGEFLKLTEEEKEKHVERLADGWSQILRA